MHSPASFLAFPLGRKRHKNARLCPSHLRRTRFPSCFPATVTNDAMFIVHSPLEQRDPPCSASPALASNWQVARRPARLRRSEQNQARPSCDKHRRLIGVIQEELRRTWLSSHCAREEPPCINWRARQRHKTIYTKHIPKSPKTLHFLSAVREVIVCL